MRGGKRIGAGRKKGFAAKSAEEARKFLSERVAQEIGPISNILISKAKKGDMRAIRELFDRAWGRAPQAVEMMSEEEKLPMPMMGIKFSEIDNEILERFHFSQAEREILEKRLIPKREKILEILEQRKL